MSNSQSSKLIQIWISEDFLIPKIRPFPLLMHETPPDTEPELKFWNLLRDKLVGAVEVRRFKKLEQAGNLVATPYPLQDYIYPGMIDSVCEFNTQVLASGRTLMTFTGAFEYTPK